MSAPATAGRPREVSVAVPVAVAGALVLLVVLFQTVGSLQTPDSRQRVGSFLSKPPGDGLGITVDEALSALRALLVLNAVLAAVVAVFAIFALQRHRGARLGQSITAGILVVTGAMGGTLVPLVIAAATALLWTRPARGWYAAAPVSGPVSDPFPAPARGPAPGPPSSPQPPAVAPDAAPAGPLFAQPPPPPGAPVAPVPAYGLTQSPQDRMPGSVIAAAALAWVFSALTLLAYLAVVVLLLVDSGRLVDAAQRQTVYAQLDLTTNEFLGILWIASVVMIGWCLAAIVCAALMLRRQRWARIAMVVSAGFALPLSLLAVPIGWVNVVAEVLMIVLVFGRPANAWFARPAAPPYPGAQQGPPHPPGNVW